MPDKEIPDHIEEVTKALAKEYPPTNPKVILETADWWYTHGKGANDPIFQQAISWLAESEGIRPMDMDIYEKFEDRLGEAV